MTIRKQEAERLRKQRERQQKVRERHKRDRKPSRDDIARVLLHMFIMRSYKTNQMHLLEGYCDMIVRRLKAQGFDKDASYVVIDDLIEKYTKSDWQFFRKLHLKDDDTPAK
ncbi:hypothetical protein FHS77_003012 [Paenochrobactrum gallinarii]|uniref:Uncharacterized protein n=1 Tax=Paenochrobactrum gallinarii TaxID=643673 RepID=A0A841M8H1_9HYPH|nr:hypothetical protein [Paenochrobactrum gallinarii]MBB6262438.1 hypothetical protein [Paenochrobactrum gallinarii]